MNLRSIASFGIALSCLPDTLNQRPTTHFGSQCSGLICCGSSSQQLSHFMIGLYQLRMPSCFSFHSLGGQKILTSVSFKSRLFFSTVGMYHREGTDESTGT